MAKRQEDLDEYPYPIWQNKKSDYWYTYYDDVASNRKKLKKLKDKENLENFIIGIVRQKREDPTVMEVFNEWNDRRLSLERISKATHLRNKQLSVKYFTNNIGNKHIKHMTADDFRDYLEEAAYEHKLTAKGFANLKSILRGTLKRAKRRNLISFVTEDAFDGLDLSFRKTIKEDYEEVFDDLEMDEMVKYLTANPDIENLGLLLLFGTGMRIGELVALKRCDIVSDNAIMIRRTETKYVDDDGHWKYTVKDSPKTSAGNRTIVVPESYAWVVKRLRLRDPFGEWLFAYADGTRMKAYTIRHRLDRLCRDLKIYHKSPHKIRKTYGSILLDANVDKRMVIDQMGHTDILTTETHYHRNRKALEKKKAILSDIPEFSVGFM